MTTTTKKTVETIAVADIIPDADQPRRTFDAQKLSNLAASIKTHGVLNPLKVQKIGDKYKLVDGERRYRAAIALKLKEVPALVSSPMSASETLVEQFQLQELHEGWSALEKALAAGRLAKELNLNVAELGRALNQPEKTVNAWSALYQLSARKEFVKNDMPLNFAKSIRSLKGSAKKAYESATGEEFSKESQHKLELDVIKAVLTGDIQKPGDMVKLRDAIMTDHKNIAMIGKSSPGKLFLNSKAQAAYEFRNVHNLASYLTSHLRKGASAKGFEEYFEGATDARSALKTAHEELAKLISRLGIK